MSFVDGVVDRVRIRDRSAASGMTEVRKEVDLGQFLKTVRRKNKIESSKKMNFSEIQKRGGGGRRGRRRGEGRGGERGGREEGAYADRDVDTPVVVSSPGEGQTFNDEPLGVRFVSPSGTS